MDQAVGDRLELLPAAAAQHGHHRQQHRRPLAAGWSPSYHPSRSSPAYLAHRPEDQPSPSPNPYPDPYQIGQKTSLARLHVRCFTQRGLDPLDVIPRGTPWCRFTSRAFAVRRGRAPTLALTLTLTLTLTLPLTTGPDPHPNPKPDPDPTPTTTPNQVRREGSALQTPAKRFRQYNVELNRESATKVAHRIWILEPQPSHRIWILTP